jgi:hypothetical protein
MTLNSCLSSIAKVVGGTSGTYLPYYTSDITYKQPFSLETIIVQDYTTYSASRIPIKNIPLSSIVIHTFPPNSVSITIS